MGDHREIEKRETLYNRWVYLLKLFRLISSIAPKEMVLIMLITLGIGLIPLLSLFSLQQLVNSITLLVTTTSNETLLNVIIWTFLLIIAFLLQGVGKIFAGMLRDHTQEGIKVHLQKMVIEKTQKLSLVQFENPKLYDQLRRANDGLDSKFFSTITSMFETITKVITLVSLLIYLAFIHWSIPLVLLIGTVIFTLIQIRFIHEMYILDRKQTTRMRKLSYLERLMTAREAAREIRLYGLGDHLRNQWNHLNEELKKERLDLARRESKLNGISSGGNTFIFAIVLTGIVYFATLGLLSVGQYAAFINAVIQFQNTLFMFFIEVMLFNNDLKYIRDFFDYLELPEENTSGISLSETRLKEGIKCDGVSFTYPGSSEPVFSNIDLTIKPGERIALVGNNGSGKTTLIKLLLGLYEPTEGSISVEGIDLKKADLSSWRKKCTAIFQDFHKYHLSIKDNIGIGQIDRIDDDGIMKAAKLSGADEVVSELAAGYDTFLGKEFDGEELSQGQWQKVAIARAYVRDADLLILDEPTAALDPQAEVEIYKQFQEVAEDKTTIFISHRLGICKLADRIIVLSNGGIAEQGTHEQLMKVNGHYAGMYELQSQWYA